MISFAQARGTTAVVPGTAGATTDDTAAGEGFSAVLATLVDTGSAVDAVDPTKPSTANPAPDERVAAEARVTADGAAVSAEALAQAGMFGVVPVSTVDTSVHGSLTGQPLGQAITPGRATPSQSGHNALDRIGGVPARPLDGPARQTTPLTATPLTATPLTGPPPGVSSAVPAAPVPVAPAVPTLPAAVPVAGGATRAAQPNTAGPGGIAPTAPTATPVPAAAPPTAESEEGAAAPVPTLDGPATPAPAAAGVRTVHAPDAPAPTTAGSPTPAAQIAVRLVPLRQDPDGVHRMTIHLNPEDLGPISVVAEVRSGDIAVRIAGMTEAGREALTAALSDLRKDLADSGFGKCSVELGQDGDGKQHRHPTAGDTATGQRPGDTDGRGQRDGPDSPERDPTHPRTHPHHHTGQRALDLHV